MTKCSKHPNCQVYELMGEDGYDSSVCTQCIREEARKNALLEAVEFFELGDGKGMIPIVLVRLELLRMAEEQST